MGRWAAHSCPVRQVWAAPSGHADEGLSSREVRSTARTQALGSHPCVQTP